MKDKENANQSQESKRRKNPQSGRKPVDDALMGMPAEEGNTRRVTRQSRYVTYYEEKSNEQSVSSQEKVKEEKDPASPTAEDIDLDEKTAQETAVELKQENFELELEEEPSQSVKVTPEKYNVEEKALRSFAEVLINQLEKLDVGDWTRPWIYGRDLRWPQNIDGREYAASNALILLMHTQQKGYQAPIYATFDRYERLNFVGGNKGQRLKDAEGKPLPWVMVKAGEKNMPVIKTIYNVYHKETKEKIPYSDYIQLPKEEQQKYNIYPRNFVYRVFNIDQTNLSEARPEFYEQLTKGTAKTFSEIRRDEDMCFPAMDAMIMKNLWQCPITVAYSQNAYYSPNADKIVIPEKRQFKFPENFYGTLFHECAHSTGAKHRYGRDLGENDHKKYAREELVAELTAALAACRYGLTKHVKCDSLPYLKSWLNDLKEEPEFIKGLLTDVRKASSQIIRRVDLIQSRVEELRNMGVPEPEYYPDFLDLNPITNQPVADPLRYVAKDQENIANAQPSVGRGRR